MGYNKYITHRVALPCAFRCIFVIGDIPLEMKKIRLSTVIIVMVLIAGVSLMLYPSFSDWWNKFHESQVVAGYVRKTDDMSRAEKAKMWEDAVEYNRRLAADQAGFTLSPQQESEYENILDVTGTGIMGYIQIDKLRINLPIYHGTSDSVMQVAIGHLEGSSVPTGGDSTHCVITGHTGLPSAKLFSDIDKLKKGDTFIISVLDHTMTYKVDQIKVVLPDETDDLMIRHSSDLCTLVTCTPYGINTHRLLVRGHRVSNTKDASDIRSDALRIDPILYLPFVIAGAAAALIIWYIVHRRSKRIRPRRTRRGGSR